MYLLTINLESADFKSHIIQYILQHLAENEGISEYPTISRASEFDFLDIRNRLFDIRQYLYPNF